MSCLPSEGLLGSNGAAAESALVSFASRQLFTVLMKRACSPSIEKRQVATLAGRLGGLSNGRPIEQYRAASGSFSHAARNELPIDKSAGKTCVLPAERRWRDAAEQSSHFFKEMPGHVHFSSMLQADAVYTHLFPISLARK